MVQNSILEKARLQQNPSSRRDCTCFGSDRTCDACSESSDGKCTLCIACINLCRRLTYSKIHANVLAIDNLLLFIENPGGHREPDKRCLYRLLQNLCIEYSFMDNTVSIHNPYLRFATPTVHRVINMFKREYFPTWCFQDSAKETWDMLPELREHSLAPDQHRDIMNRIVMIWWESNGMPLILTDRKTAQLTRKMLRHYMLQRGAFSMQNNDRI